MNTCFLGMLQVATEMRAAEEIGSILSLPCDAGERYLPGRHDEDRMRKDFAPAPHADGRFHGLPT